VISGGGDFTEASLVDLDRHTMDESYFDEYDYSSDSDLDSEEIAPAPAEAENRAPDNRKDTPSPVEKSSDSAKYVTFPPLFTVRCRPSTTSRMLCQDPDYVEIPSPPRRMGRVVVVKSTAFKT
jgi:hypothetical protein